MKYTYLISLRGSERRETCKGCCGEVYAFLDGNSLQCEKGPEAMRLYIRNKVKYDPLNAGKPLIFVDFPDPRGFSVGQVKEVSYKLWFVSADVFFLFLCIKQLSSSS